MTQQQHSQQYVKQRPIAIIAPDVATLQTAFLQELETLRAQGRVLHFYLPDRERQALDLAAVAPGLAAQIHVLPAALAPASTGASSPSWALTSAATINALSQVSSLLKRAHAGIVIGVGQQGCLLAGLAGAMADTPFRYGVLDEFRQDNGRPVPGHRWDPRRAIGLVGTWLQRQLNTAVMRTGFKRIDGLLVRSGALRDQLVEGGLLSAEQQCLVVPAPFEPGAFEPAPLHAIGAGLCFLHISAPGDGPSLAAFVASAAAITRHGGRAQFRIACLPGHDVVDGRLAEDAAAAKIEIYHLPAGERLVGPAHAISSPVAVVSDGRTDVAPASRHAVNAGAGQPLLTTLLADAHVCIHTPSAPGPLQPLFAALAMGRPLIVGDLPGLRELVASERSQPRDGATGDAATGDAARADIESPAKSSTATDAMTNGAVVDGASAQALANAMAAILRRPDQIAAMCRASRNHAFAALRGTANVSLGLGLLQPALAALDQAASRERAARTASEHATVEPPGDHTAHQAGRDMSSNATPERALPDHTPSDIDKEPCDEAAQTPTPHNARQVA